LRFHYDTVTAHGNYMTQLITKAVADIAPEQPDLPTDVGDTPASS
jgi:hypothetical protein